MYWVIGWPVKKPNQKLNANRLNEIASLDFSFSMEDESVAVAV
jgi:hypothetical protein